VLSNIIFAEGFAARFDGFSISSNHLTQLVLAWTVIRRSRSSLNIRSQPAETYSQASARAPNHPRNAGGVAPVEK
jgi:phosphoenolpyruvate synthase/pyruvate phosphate dikinase